MIALVLKHFAALAEMEIRSSHKSPQAVQKGRPARPQQAKRRRRTLRYVELLSDARTQLAGFFNSLLVFRRIDDMQSRRF